MVGSTLILLTHTATGYENKISSVALNIVLKNFRSPYSSRLHTDTKKSTVAVI